MMADITKLTVCPVCSHDYQVEGEHIPFTLCCLCTFCEQCIRGRLCEGISVTCPLCGTENGIEKIRKNKNLISHIDEIADKVHKKKDSRSEGKKDSLPEGKKDNRPEGVKDSRSEGKNNRLEKAKEKDDRPEGKKGSQPEGEKECSKHGEEVNLFCKECQTPVCILCLEDEHKEHKNGDLREATDEICSGLLEDVEWMKDTLQKKKDDIVKVRQMVAENCQECTKEVITRKDHLIREINQIAEKLVGDITEHKNKVDTGINKTFVYIDEKLDLVKDFEIIAKSKAILEVETQKLARFKDVKDEIQFSFSETTPYDVLSYMKSDDITDCFSHLCGKLEKHESKVMDQKISGDSSLQEKGNRDILTTTTPTATASALDRDCLREKTSANNSSHRASDTPVPAVKHPSMDGKSEENVPQSENTPDELLKRVNSLLAKAGKLLPSTNTEAPVENPGSTPDLQSKGDATEVPTAVVSFAGTQSTNDVSGRSTAPPGLGNLRDPRKCTSHLYDRRDDVQIVAEPVAKKARLEATSDEDSQSSYEEPWQVLQCINAGFEKLSVMDLLPDNSVVVCGKGSISQPSARPDTRPKFVAFNTMTGDRICNVSSEHTRMPFGMTVFTTADGCERIAFTYRESQVIDFYDVNNLRTVVQSYSVAPDYPSRLCTSRSSAGTILYTICKPNKQVVKWLDCSNYPPTLKDTRTNIPLIGNQFIEDMCLVTQGKTDLLVVTQNYGGVYAYVAGTDDLRWYFGGYQRGINKWINAVGITNNGLGQLFVCDISNNCIQMLSTDGTFLGTVLRGGKNGLGNPQRIRWCSEANSLVIAHKRQGLFSIDVLQWLYSLYSEDDICEID